MSHTAWGSFDERIHSTFGKSDAPWPVGSLVDRVKNSRRSKQHANTADGDEKTGSYLITAISIAVAGVIAAIFISTAVMRRYRRQKHDSLTLAQKGAAADAVRLVTAHSPSAHDNYKSQQYQHSPNDTYSANDVQTDGRVPSQHQATVDSSQQTMDRAPIYVMWIITPHDLVSKYRGDGGHYSDKIMIAARTLFSSAYHAARVRLMCWVYDGESASQHQNPPSNTNLPSDESQSPLFKRYSKDCFANQDLNYSANITVRHMSAADWRGIYFAQYEMIAFMHSRGAIARSDRDDAFILLGSPYQLMVKHWDKLSIGEWLAASHHVSGSGNDAVLTCQTPSQSQVEQALAEIDASRKRAVQKNAALHDAGYQAHSMSSPLEAGVGTTHEEDVINRQVERYQKSYQFALDSSNFLPGTWSSFDHWCAVECDLRSQPSSAGSNSKSSFKLHALPPEHQSLWQVYLPVCKRQQQQQTSGQVNFLQKNVIDAARRSGGTPLVVETGWFESSFAFAKARVIMEMPPDPRWIGFGSADGVDFIQSVRLWTNGCRFFHPSLTICISSGATRKSSSKVPHFAYQSLYRYLHAICNDGASILHEAQNDTLSSWRMFGNRQPMSKFYAQLGVSPDSGEVTNEAKLGIWSALDIDEKVEQESNILLKYGSWQTMHDAYDALFAFSRRASSTSFSPYTTSSVRLKQSNREEEAVDWDMIRRLFMLHFDRRATRID